MLTKPQYGWTDFSLEDTGVYGLSYLDDIAFEWTEQAIHGLDTMLPFCVKGFMEPGRLLCTVSYYNCYILVENEMDTASKEKTAGAAYSHTSMIEFCRMLYQDISAYLDEWADFADYRSKEESLEEKRRRLSLQLERLGGLIEEKKDRFGPGRCFL